MSYHGRSPRCFRQPELGGGKPALTYRRLFGVDRFFSEVARPHRKRFIGYALSFVAWCGLVVPAFGSGQ